MSKQPRLSARSILLFRIRHVLKSGALSPSKGAWRSRNIWIDRASRSNPSIHSVGRLRPATLLRA